jgi:HEAT repeat protein
MMKSDDPAIRQQAAKEMAAHAEHWAISALLKLLTDVYGTVREAAKTSLVKIGPPAVTGLLEGLNHANHDLGKTCAEILGEIQSPEAIEQLILTLKFGSRPVQLACRKALERIGAAAKGPLEAARGETQPWVREQIEAILSTYR